MAKLRGKYSRLIKSTEATKRRTAYGKMIVLDSLCASETLLTDDLRSLQETARLQNISKCLTNIHDKGYNFFQNSQMRFLCYTPPQM